MINARRIFSQLCSCKRGTIGILFALSFVAILAMVGVALDIARLSYVRSRAQNALDAAALAAVNAHAGDTAAMTLEANNFFAAHYPAGFMNASFGAVAVSTLANNSTYNFTATGSLPNYIMPAFGSAASNTVALSSRVTRTTPRLDIALILDVNENMGNRLGNITRLAALRAAATLFIRNLLADPGFPASNSTLSFIAYADAVKLDPLVANNWLQTPYPNPNHFDGCLSNRNNANDTTAVPPTTGSPATLFPLYAGTGCTMNQSAFFIDATHTTDMFDFLNNLSLGTAERSNVGLSWGWYSLDPGWRGILVPSNTNYPKNYTPTIPKVAIIVTQGANATPSDDTEFLALCQNMRLKGVAIFTIALASDANVQALLQQCANDAKHSFIANNRPALNVAFTRIAQSIVFWHIVP